VKRWKQASQFPKPEDWMFASPAKLGRLPWSADAVNDACLKAAKLAGTGHASTHSMRHTYRTWLDAGGDPDCRTAEVDAARIDFVSVTESVDTSLPSGELVFQMIGAVAQFERSLIGERVKSGLANARAKGKALGRPPLRRLSTGETHELRTERARRNVPFRALAKKFGVSVWTAHRLCLGRAPRF
jgi:hypothetical protein